MNASGTIRRTMAPWLLLSPGIVLVAILLLWPIGYGLWLSLHRFDGLTTGPCVGLANYAGVASDPQFDQALGHTALFALIAVVGKTLAGLGLAMLVNSRIPGARPAQLALFLPVTLNIVVVGAFASQCLASAQYGGLLDRALESVGLGNLARSWLTEPGLALIVVALIEVWRWSGLHMLIFLAALQAIEPSSYDAARLDGAGALRRFWSITLPALGPIIGASTMLALIGAFVRSFDIVWVLTRASFGTDVLGTYIYREAFAFGRFDRATAAGLMLAAGLALTFSCAGLITRRGEG